MARTEGHEAVTCLGNLAICYAETGRLDEAKLRMEEICCKRDALIDALKAMLRPDA